MKKTYRAVYEHEDIGNPKARLPSQPYITKDIEIPKGKTPKEEAEEAEKIAKSIMLENYEFKDVFPTD